MKTDDALLPSALSAEDNAEYIQYAQDVEQTLSALEAGLHNTDDPEEIIMSMLKVAVDFYDGDWAGIMEADLVMKVWSPLWWYNKHTDGMTPNNFQDLEEGEFLIRWIDALMHGKPVVITDLEEIAESSPAEYQFMKANHAHTLLAVPFWKRPTGFLIIRNPKKYLSRSSLLQMMAFVAVSSVNEKRLLDRTQLTFTPEQIKNKTDILINVFDELQIITSKGILSAKDLKSPKICKLIVYLLLHNRRPASPYEIVQDLWPKDDVSKAGSNVKSLIYRFQQMFNMISDYRLIESTPSGYCINPDLNIITDLQIFEDYWNEAQITADISSRGHLLKKALEIYKNGPMFDYNGEHWFMPTVAHYSLRYIGVLNQLLTTLERANDYVCIYEYANKALSIFPSSVDAYYWLLIAMNRMGLKEIAQNELKAAEQAMIDLEYQELRDRLTNAGVTFK